MSGSTQTVQVTRGIRQLGAAIVAIALGVILTGVVVFSALTASRPEAAPAAGAEPSVIDQGSGSGGSNSTRFPQ